MNEGLFSVVGVDFVGPLPITNEGNHYIIVATEAMTRWPIAKAGPNHNLETADRFIFE